MARLAHKAGVLCIMFTIKDSISSLILFTSPTVAWATSCFYKYRGEGRKGKEIQMQTYICWSNKFSAKSVDEDERKTEMFKYAFELRAR